jgi:hypothetical protein
MIEGLIDKKSNEKNKKTEKQGEFKKLHYSGLVG